MNCAKSVARQIFPTKKSGMGKIFMASEMWDTITSHKESKGRQERYSNKANLCCYIFQN